MLCIHYTGCLSVIGPVKIYTTQNVRLSHIQTIMMHFVLQYKTPFVVISFNRGDKIIHDFYVILIQPIITNLISLQYVQVNDYSREHH